MADSRGQSSNMIGRAYEPGRPSVGGGSALARALELILSLVLPVLLLGSLGVLAFLYGDQPVVWFGPATAQWLTMGHLILPLTFFAIELTNRRYGAAFAAAQIGLTWLLGLAVIFAVMADLPALAGRALPPTSEAAGFAVALFAAQLFSVFVFDRTRGPRWWMAPLQASLWGGLLFCIIAFPLSYNGMGIDWSARMIVYGQIMIAASVLMLLPYWLLRSIVPPLSGFGGY